MAIPDKPITREEMYLEEIARNGGGGGGSSLPPVETTDYGKFLKADDTTGELEWSDAGGGASGGTPILLTLTPTDPQDPFEGTWSGATAAELEAAWANGTPIRIDLGGNQLTLATRAPYPLGGYEYDATFTYSTGGVTLLVTGIVLDDGTYDCAYFPLGT